MNCPKCDTRTEVIKTDPTVIEGKGRLRRCPSHGDFWTVERVARWLRVTVQQPASNTPATPTTDEGYRQPPGNAPPTGGQPPGNLKTAGGVGGALPSVSGPDPESGPISPADPDRARAVSGYELCRLFSQVRAGAVGGLPWQSVRVAGGAASDMAAAINEDPGARADVVPSMELLFKLAKAGKAGDRSSDIVKSGSFAFGAWLAKWTELREQLHAKLPRAADDTAVRATAQRVASIMAAGAAPAPTREQLAALRPPKRVSVVIKDSDGSERPVDLEATG